MRASLKWFLLFASCLLLPAAAFGQTTVVSGTVVDPSGIPYAFGTVKAQLTSPGATVTNNNQAQCISAARQRALPAPHSGHGGTSSRRRAGHFSMMLYSNTSISPAATQWVFTVAISPGVLPPWGTGQQNFTASITITGATQNISTTLNALAPALTVAGAGLGSVISVSCGNLVNIFTCSVTNPTTTPALSFAPLSSGPSLDCSTFPGADMGAKLNACLAALPAAGGIADGTKFISPQTISTAVVNSYPAVILTGGIAITQTANVSLTGSHSCWSGIPGQPTIVTKGANIDQITISGDHNCVIHLTLDGDRSGGFTGDGIVLGAIQYPTISDTVIASEAGQLINDGGTGWASYHGLRLSDYGVNAMLLTSVFQENVYDVNLQSSGDETGSAIHVNGSNAQISFDQLTSYITGSFPVMTSSGLPTINITNSGLQQTGGYPVYADIPGAGVVLGISTSNLYGGGAGGPVIKANNAGDSVIVADSVLTNSAASDVIEASGDQVSIHDNQIQFNVGSATNQAAIKAAVQSNSAFIHHNQIIMAGAPGGQVYGVWIVQPAVLGSSFNIISENRVTGNSDNNDIGYFYDNSVGFSGAGPFNQFLNNECALVSTTVGCILRTDAQNLTNIYTDNISGSVPLFATGGSTNDVVVTHRPDGITFATLPTAGPGSEVYCTDCYMGDQVSGTGTGGTVYRKSMLIGGATTAVWSGSPSIVGKDSHTAEITGNYAPVVLVDNSDTTDFYLVTIYTEVSTGVATSTITVSINYADDTGAQSQSGALFSAATTGTIQSLTFPVRFVTGTNLTYSTTTANSPKYKIFARATAQ